jgi:hypothetical protein
LKAEVAAAAASPSADGTLFTGELFPLGAHL